MRRTLGIVAPHVRGHRTLMAGGVLALLFEVVFRVLEPWPVKFVVDAVSARLGADLEGAAQATSGLFLACGAAVVLIVGMRALTNYLATVAFALAGSRIATHLRARVFAHVQRLSVVRQRRARRGDVVQRLVGDVGKLQDVAVTAGLPLLANVITLLVMAVVMAVLDPLLASVVVLACLAYALLSQGSTGRITQAARKTRRGEGKLADIAQESLGATDVVHAYGLEDEVSGRFAGSNAKTLKEGVQAKRLAAGLERRTDVIVGVATALVLAGGGWRVTQGAMTPGDLVIFLTYLKTAMKPLRDLAKYTGRIARATASGERVADLLDVPIEIDSDPGARALTRPSGHLRFVDVHAGYGTPEEYGVPVDDRAAQDHGTPGDYSISGAHSTPGDPGQSGDSAAVGTVLHGLDLEIPAGQSIAVVGPSGAGKSTLAMLALRLLDPVAGRVEIDGADLRSVTLESLRSHTAYVPQDTVLFSGTIRDNIRFGRLDATDAEVVAAARAAYAEDFILRQPDGYDTVVGERGGTLSGGQRQRIAVARAILRDASVVVLDEATTGLDPASARAVRNALERLTRGRTTLSITHDAATALAADRVVWIEDGRILADGPPFDLLGRGEEHFTAWVESQRDADDGQTTGDGQRTVDHFVESEPTAMVPYVPPVPTWDPGARIPALPAHRPGALRQVRTSVDRIHVRA
ncbi:ABC transporter ATP-binding protein [Brevibacterium yomogidense]|uniref:ABC transporter ATP-binding protein n=1 Tax=Brevibacterium yomogidense TaxID=946573 RepID=UPI001E482743|nr:ABC transporter ATP-binding protein [Brevibacterium yomogidense]